MFGSLNLTQMITVPQEYAAYYKHPAIDEEPVGMIGKSP